MADLGIPVVIQLGSAHCVTAAADATLNSEAHADPSVVGRFVARHTMSGMDFPPMSYGHTPFTRVSAYSCEALFPRGRATDREAVRGFLDTLVKNTARVDATQRSFMLIHPLLQSLEERALLAEVMFEWQSAPAVSFEPGAPLALAASGRTTGAVASIGHGLTQSCLVRDGAVVVGSAQRVDLGGTDVVARFRHRLNAACGGPFTTHAHDYLVMETLCHTGCVAAHCCCDGSDATGFKGVVLPDSSVLKVPISAVEQSTEVLFHPERWGLDVVSVQDALHASIFSAMPDRRTEFLSDILLYGGCSAMTGFHERLHLELGKKLPTAAVTFTRPVGTDLHQEWTGGAALAQLSTFASRCITKAEYEEHGVSILSRRQ